MAFALIKSCSFPSPSFNVSSCICIFVLAERLFCIRQSQSGSSSSWIARVAAKHLNGNTTHMTLPPQSCRCWTEKPKDMVAHSEKDVFPVYVHVHLMSKDAGKEIKSFFYRSVLWAPPKITLENYAESVSCWRWDQDVSLQLLKRWLYKAIHFLTYLGREGNGRENFPLYRSARRE